MKKFKNKKLLIASIGILILGMMIFALSKFGLIYQTDNSNRLQVATSFYPLYYFAAEVGGEKTNVVNITPAGAEPHDYEPSTGDIQTIQNSKILFINGEGLEPWAGKIMGITSNTQVVEVAKGLATLTTIEDDEQIADPHIWLDPVLASKEVDRILAAYEQVDSQNTNYYKQNASSLKNKLNNLDNAFKSGLTNCTSRNIITSHAAFGYLAQRYNLKQIAIAGLSPDSEPSVKDIAQVADFAKKNNVKYIFFESLISPKLAQTIADEVGAQTLVFNPLEGLTKQEIANGENYFTTQESNLKNLEIALNCR